MVFYKIIGANKQTDPNFKFEVGEMDISNIQDVDGTYVTDIKHIFAYINYGPYIAEIEVNENDHIVYDPESAALHQELPGWKVYKFRVNFIDPIATIHMIKYLIICGADPTIEEFLLLRNLYTSHPDVLFFLKEVWWIMLSAEYSKDWVNRYTWDQVVECMASHGFYLNL